MLSLLFLASNVQGTTVLVIMILALLVVTGMASHDGTFVVAKQETLRTEKAVAEVPDKTNRPN